MTDAADADDPMPGTACRAQRRPAAPSSPSPTSAACWSWPAGCVERGWELVSTGGTARAIREAGLPVTDVAAVTGAPEMLDGRVKTLHPRIAGGVLADLRLPSHREQLAEQGIEPFELVIVNLYRFEEAAARPERRRRRAHRGDRHRRAHPRARGGQEPRLGRHRLRPGRLPGRPRRAGRARRAHGRHAARPGPQGLPTDGGLRRGHRRHPVAPLGARRTASRNGSPWGCAAHSCCATARTPTRPRPSTRWPAADPAAGPFAARRHAPGRQAALLQQPARRRRRGGPGARPAGCRGRHRQARQPLRRGEAARPARGLGACPRGRPGERLRRRRGGARPRGRRRSPRPSRASSWRSSSPPASTRPRDARLADTARPAARRGRHHPVSRRSPPSRFAAPAARILAHRVGRPWPMTRQAWTRRQRPAARRARAGRPGLRLAGRAPRASRTPSSSPATAPSWGSVLAR